jgi:ureidoacrylate peracid hydrolase
MADALLGANKFSARSELPRSGQPAMFSADEQSLLYKTALVVVDMQYFDAHRDWGEGLTAKQLGVLQRFDEYFRQIDTITPTIRALLDLFRAKRMEVIHLRVAEVTKDSRDVGLKQLVRGLIVPIDSKEAEFLEGLEPADDEIVISKSSSGVFPATNIDRILRNIGIEHLIFTGTSTSGCVQSAIYDALDLGYQVSVVADACADATDASQEQALAHINRQRVPLVTSAQIMRRVAALPPADPARKSGIERARPYTLSSPYLPNDRAPKEVSPYALIFGPAITLDLRRDNTALVLVDAQRLTCDPSSSLAQVIAGDPEYAGFYARVPAALDAMARLRAACRKLGLPVIHIRTAGHLADGRDLSANLRRLGVRSTVGDADAEFMPHVSPAPGEIVINKPGGGIFTGTGLDELLRNIGAEHIVLAGITVEAAIERSIRSAGDRGYGVLLASDACAGDASAEAQIRGYEKATVTVRNTKEAIDRLAKLA